MSMVCLPLTHRDRVIGVLKVYDARPHAFGAEDVMTLDLLSGLIAAHMAHATDFQAHLHESRHDALTGLANRRAFDERLGSEMARVRRHGGRLSVALLDLNRFKQVNDTHGHAAGDAVLRAVALHLSQMRGEDSTYRLGGDEFAVVLIEADAAAAEMLLRRLASTIAADPECLGVGATWGVTAYEPADDATTLLARADAALYRAKPAVAA